MDYEYRRALPGDKDELVDVRMKFLREVQQIEDLSDESEVRRFNDSYFSRGMESGDVICFIAVYNGKIVGTSGLCFLNRPPSFKNPAGTIGYIMNMFRALLIYLIWCFNLSLIALTSSINSSYKQIIFRLFLLVMAINYFVKNPKRVIRSTLYFAGVQASGDCGKTFRTSS